MLIRKLVPAEVALVARFYREAPDYWVLAEGHCAPDRLAAEFFTEAPPGGDPADSHHLGLFLTADDLGPVTRGMATDAAPRLSGVAELAFRFPEPGDAYLGLMILGPWAQGAGWGRKLLAEVERLARDRDARRLCLAVLDVNPRGRAFWLREGFQPTGLGRSDPATGHWTERLVKTL